MTRRFLFGLLASPLAARVLPVQTRARLVNRTTDVSWLYVDIANEYSVKIDVQVDGHSNKWTIPPGPRRTVSVPCSPAPKMVKITNAAEKPFRLWSYTLDWENRDATVSLSRRKSGITS